APSVQGGEYGPVHSGDTLWGIANRMRSADVSVNQMMLALQSANPDAFYKDNINALKRGAVLRIPTHAEQDAMTTAAAIAEVRRQNQDWTAAAPRRPTVMASAGAGKAATPQRPASANLSGAGGTSAGDHLKLVPPSDGGESTGARAGVANGSDKVTVQQLHQDVARAREALSSAKQQTADLESRLKSLKDIQDKNDRLMSLKNAEIAELQNKLAAAGKPVPGASSAMPAMSGSVASAASSAKASSAMTPAVASVAASGSAMKPAAATTATVKKPASKPAAVTPAKPAPQPWYAALLGSLWAKIAAAAVVILALLALLLRGRRGKAAPRAGAGPSLADQFGDSPLGDASGEAFDEEQDTLLRELAENPEDIGLHLELVSLYYARRDVDRFEAAAEVMHTHVSDPQQPEWQDVMAMGEELAPDYPLFAGSAEAYAPDIPDETAMDHDVHAVPHDAQHDNEMHGASEDASHEPISEYSYDFDLTSGAHKTEPEAPSEDEFDALPPLPGEDAPAPFAHVEDDIEGFDLPELEAEPETPSPVAQNEPAHADPAPTFDLEPEPEAPSAADTFDLDIDEGDDVAPTAGLGGDAVDTKIDLARAYMDMGDPDGARAMLEEVLAEGSGPQREVAQKLLDELD
ncbi:hypothetical protein LF63_0110500, partial [Oleiagrimonas soli]